MDRTQEARALLGTEIARTLEQALFQAVAAIRTNPGADPAHLAGVLLSSFVAIAKPSMQERDLIARSSLDQVAVILSRSNRSDDDHASFIDQLCEQFRSASVQAKAGSPGPTVRASGSRPIIPFDEIEHILGADRVATLQHAVQQAYVAAGQHPFGASALEDLLVVLLVSILNPGKSEAVARDYIIQIWQAIAQLTNPGSSRLTHLSEC